MKAVMISIRPKWVEKIIRGEKTVEVRKTAPKLETPFKCFIYVTQGKVKELGDYSQWIYENRMKVIGEFTCDSISEIKPHNDGYGANSYTFMSIEYNKGGNGSCLNFEQLNDYLKGRKGYALHISDLKIYDKPKEISEFKKYSNCEFTDCEFNNECINCFEYSDILKSCSIDLHLTRPPQSWCYVEIPRL